MPQKIEQSVMQKPNNSVLLIRKYKNTRLRIQTFALPQPLHSSVVSYPHPVPPPDQQEGFGILPSLCRLLNHHYADTIPKKIMFDDRLFIEG